MVSLLTEQTMVGTLGNLYESVHNLQETCFQSSRTKHSLLNPKVPLSATQVPLLKLDGSKIIKDKRYYTCPNRVRHPYVAQDSRAFCPICSRKLCREVTYVESPNEVAATGEGGFVKRYYNFTVNDDLVVTQSTTSTISGITMLNKFNVKEVGPLEERVVHFGMTECLKLLEASLHSKKVLTTVFLGNTCSGLKR